MAHRLTRIAGVLVAGAVGYGGWRALRSKVNKEWRWCVYSMTRFMRLLVVVTGWTVTQSVWGACCRASSETEERAPCTFKVCVAMCLLSVVAWCLVLARLKQVQALQESEVFDVLVIGGGVTGCGVALDSVTRGESVNKMHWSMARSKDNNCWFICDRDQDGRILWHAWLHTCVHECVWILIGSRCTKSTLDLLIIAENTAWSLDCRSWKTLTGCYPGRRWISSCILGDYSLQMVVSSFCFAKSSFPSLPLPLSLSSCFFRSQNSTGGERWLQCRHQQS